MPESLFDRFATALVAALATTLIAVLSEWLKRRGHDARVKQDVDQAISRANFLSAWLTLQERLSQSEAEAARVAISHELVAIREEAQRTWMAARQARRSALRQAMTKLLMLGLGRDLTVRARQLLLRVESLIGAGAGLDEGLPAVAGAVGVRGSGVGVEADGSAL